MKVILKELIAVFLVIVIIFSVCPFVVQADSEKNDIKIGDYITLGTYYNEPIVWRCVDIDENGPLMLSDKILCFKSFDAKGEHGNYYRNKEGTNNWKNSALRYWLNSYGDVNWGDRFATPSEENVFNGYNSYDSEIGFLSSFNMDELSVIKRVKQKTYINSLDKADADGGNEEYDLVSSPFSSSLVNTSKKGENCFYQIIEDSVFIIDAEQAERIYENFGAAYLTASATNKAVENDSSGRTIAGEKYDCWIRVPGTNGMSYETVMTISPNEEISYMSALSVRNGNTYYSVGVRPAFYLNSDKYNNENESSNTQNLNVSIHEDIVFLDVGESYQFSAYDADGMDITDSLKWKSNNEGVADFISLGYVRTKSRGLITVSAEKSYEEIDYCYIYVGEPNYVEYDTVYDTDYYYSDGGFYSNAAYISDTVDIYLSLKNSVADEMQSLYNKDVLLENYKDEFETLNLGEFTISATVSGNDLSFKKDSYSNSYSATYSGISIEQAVDELLMLYPYNLTASANKKTYNVTVKIEADDFETIEDTITFSVSDLASKAANEHSDYLNTNIPYKTSLRNSYGTNMVKIKDDPEYKWSKYSTFDFENYHQIVVADMLINMLNVAQFELPSLIPSVMKEYNDVQKEIVSTINTIVCDDYADAIDLTDNAIDKLFKVSKYRKDGIYTEDVTFQLIQKIFGNVSNAEKINKAFEVADKTKQVFKFVSFGANAVKDVVNWCNKISVFNAYQDAGNALNEVFEKLYDTIPSSEVEMREAVADYINYANTGFTLTSEIIESIGELSVGITFDAVKTLLDKGFLELISGSVCNWIGSITLSSGATFATTAAFATVQAAFGGFVTGVAVGLCLTDFLCDSSGKSEEMSKIIAMSEYTPYIVETVKYYENNLYNNRNDYAVELFENAFTMHKASQSYVIEHTIKALEVKRDSIIEKLMNREDDYEGVIADALVDKLHIDAMVCHSTDNNDTIVRKTKVIAIKCPVNVFVYDEEGCLVVDITDNIVKYCADGIEVCISESEKYIAVPADREYDVKIIATDNGTMDYAVREYDESDQLLRKVEKADIPLETDKEFSGKIVNTSDEQASEEDYAITSGNEKYVPVEDKKTVCVINGHTPGSWEVVVEAQVGAEGLEQQKCTVCGEVIDERKIPALPDVINIVGDMNIDGKVTAADARLALRISAKIDELSDYALLVGDINQDSKITAADARRILRIAAKLE